MRLEVRDYTAGELTRVSTMELAGGAALLAEPGQAHLHCLPLALLSLAVLLLTGAFVVGVMRNRVKPKPSPVV